jgi:hypothetical protein
MSGEKASFNAEDEALHVVAATSESKTDPSAEVRAGEMVAAVLLQRKAKVRTPLPEWLPAGFGRATSYRVLGPREKFVVEDRKTARGVLRKRNPSDLWGTVLEPEEAAAIQGSVAEFFAYGPGSARFAKLLAAFVPGEDVESRTMSQALEAVDLTNEKINAAFRAWMK